MVRYFCSSISFVKKLLQISFKGLVASALLFGCAKEEFQEGLIMANGKYVTAPTAQ